MHRLATSAIALTLSTPATLWAQQFQFMRASPRAAVSLLPANSLSPDSSFRGPVVVDDFNGDGSPDVVATYQRDLRQGFIVFAGSPTGAFTPWWSAPPGSHRGLVPVDLDGDGDRDLALVPNDPAMPIDILLYQNALGGFQPVALPTAIDGPSVQGAAPGDVDGDGLIDLVIAVTAASSMPSIVLARGGPGLQFTMDVTSTPAGLPRGLWPVLLDADGDGDLDVLANGAASGLRLLHNNGGTFLDATATLPTMPPGYTFLLAADLDGDGSTDCAAVRDSGLIDVLWGSPGGLAFAPGVAQVPTARSLSPADFDGDGDLELLVDRGSGLDVLWNQGLRQFARSELTRHMPLLHGTGDVDGDGMDDFVFKLANEEFVRCKYRGRFEDAAAVVGVRPIPWATVGSLVSMTMSGDVDGDGRTDLVTVGELATVVDHALGGGAYRQSTSAMSAPPGSGQWLAFSELADVDGDGDLDLVARMAHELAIGTNDGNGAFTRSLRIPGRIPLSAPLDGLEIADIDGDGNLDIVMTEGVGEMTDGGGVMLIRTLRGGQYAAPVMLVPPTPAASCIEVADVDCDGDLDVISNSVAASGTHVIVANDGAGNFAPDPAFHVDLGPRADAISAGDLDGDGDADLVVTGEGLRVYRNDGAGSFTDRTALDLPPTPGVVWGNPAVADFDEDGDLDIAAVRNPPLGGNAWLLLLNDGSGRFTDRTASRVELVGSLGGVVHAEDVDDDGDLDLLTGSRLQTWMNQLRQCRSAVLPRLGGLAAFDLLSGPGFSQSGLVALGLASVLTATPMRVPGMRGTLDLDPTSLQILGTATTSSVGMSTVFVPVPQDPALICAELWFQGAVLPSVGPPGFTNAVYEVVLR